MGTLCLQDLVEMVFALQPIGDILEMSEELGLLSNINTQLLFIKSIFFCDVYKRFPLPLTYCKTLLYRIIKKIESLNEEVSESLYSCLSQIHKEDTNQISKDSHIILSIKNPEEINYSNKTQESSVTRYFAFRFEYCNSVGMRPWSAGFYLTEWLIHCSKFNRGVLDSNIIELGSGIGVASIVTFLTIQISSIFSTDFDKNIVDNIKYNYSINGVEFDQMNESDDEFNYKVKVGCLDWETMNIYVAGELVKSLKNPLIISSDVIYDNKLTLSYTRAIMHILRAAYKKKFGKYPNNHINTDVNYVNWRKLPIADFEYIQTYAISINTLRNEKTIQYFVNCCIENGMKVSIDKTEIPTLFKYELSTPIIVFIIHF
ncbi:hypothetical protein FG386_003550 [Cryptosporidium ryanae]|uniref:uncharacterized protein n=1 Tax=Cryptosporidium ryanae TaxID=515981 RepID=UPI00351A823C|nr:hypothetical protein FG386_003550 [Cryptosporidium ryanae]